MKTRLLGIIGVATSAAAVLIGLLLLTSCGGAIRLPVRSHGPSGANIENRRLDLSLLRSGATSRSEVLDKLAPIDAASSNPRLFWGRWSESKWGYWWFVAAPGGGAAGDAKRIWHVKNVLLSFDEHGVLQEQQVFENDRAVWPALRAMLSQAPPLDLSEPVRVPVYARGTQEVSLSKDSLEMDFVAHKKKSAVRISPLDVVRFSHSGTGDKSSHPAFTCHTLHLSKKTAAGTNIHICGDAPAIVTMFQYLHQVGHPNMRWE